MNDTSSNGHGGHENRAANAAELHALFRNQLDAVHVYYKHFVASFIIFLGINSALLIGLLNVAMAENTSQSLKLTWLNIFCRLGVALAILYVACVIPQHWIRKRLLANLNQLNASVGKPIDVGSLPLLRSATFGILLFGLTVLVGWIAIWLRPPV